MRPGVATWFAVLALSSSVAGGVGCARFGDGESDGDAGGDAASEAASDARPSPSDGGLDGDAGEPLCEARLDYFACLVGTNCYACFTTAGANPSGFSSCASTGAGGCRSCVDIDMYCEGQPTCASVDPVCTRVSDACRAKCAAPR